MPFHGHDFLLFDLDGTLSDPIKGIARSLNYALTSFGYNPREVNELAAYVGPPIDQTFKELTGSSQSIHLQELVAKYRERYGEIGYAENVLYPEIKDVLAKLHHAGVSMAVCTSKREDFARRILELFDLQDYFLFVNGGDTGIHKWQQIENLVAQKKVTRASLMIGDRAVDLVAAHKNGLYGAGVLWGYGSLSELAMEKPRYMFSKPLEWLQLLE
jgi:phosphoglycolate phosphatase